MWTFRGGGETQSWHYVLIDSIDSTMTDGPILETKHEF